jgi:hypothetical protein
LLLQQAMQLLVAWVTSTFRPVAGGELSVLQRQELSCTEVQMHLQVSVQHVLFSDNYFSKLLAWHRTEQPAMDSSAGIVTCILVAQVLT